MLSRRTLLATSAALAVGCGRAKPPVSAPTQLNVAAFIGFATVEIRGLGCHERVYQDVVDALERDTESPYGATRGRYSLDLKFIDELFPGANWKTPPDVALDTVAALLDELDADLVTVWPELAQWLGRRGLLLPLDQFSGADKETLEREFFPVALDRYRADGALYALPVSAAPLMLYYHARHFRERGVPPVDASWDWDDLVENAIKLTMHTDDGAVQRWGLVAHHQNIWWALWQNGADALDPDALGCRLQELAAVEALQFVHELIRKHGVSPPLGHIELYDIFNSMPPAMRYAYSHDYLDTGIYRMAALPRGKEYAVPVHDGFGIGIATRTPRTEAAFTALQGFTNAMQGNVKMPAKREAVAGLKGFQYSLQPEEITAVERSLEHGRPVPLDILQEIAIGVSLESIVRSEDVATAVNRACAAVRKRQQNGKLSPPIPLMPNPRRYCESAR